MTHINQPTLFRALLGVMACLALALTIIPACAEGHFDPGVTGQWKLTSVLDFADVTALDENEAQRMVGKVLKIDRATIKLGKRTCGASTFRVERVKRDSDLRDNAHLRDTTLGLPKQVDVIELSCAFLYRKTSDRAVLAWEGVFFDVVRVPR
ncbi:MAG TPA: hypothetical protein VF774_17210 [Pseudoduganella sp.]